MKFKKSKGNKTTLSDKIADALTLKPRADIEDDQVFGTKPKTVLRADFSTSDSEDEAAISEFRKRNVNLLSEVSKKYEGQVVSRKDLKKTTYESSDESVLESDQSRLENTENDDSEYSDSSESITKNDLKLNFKSKIKSHSENDSDSNVESDDYSINQFKKHLENDDDSNEESDAYDEEEEEGEGYDISQLEQPLKEDFEHVKKQNVPEEAKKGKCVRNQLLLWEGLLEMRIHLQRCLNTANQMPMPDTHSEMKQNSEFLNECNATKVNITKTLDKFLSIQNILFKKFPETKNLSVKQNQHELEKSTSKGSDEEIPSDSDNEEIPSDTEDDVEDIVKEEQPKKEEKSQTVSKKRKLEDYEKEISLAHKAFKPFRDTTIQKWNEKTRLATTTNMKSTIPTNTILQQISYILSDKDKLLRRTQLKRSEYDIVGYKSKIDDSEALCGNGNVIRDRKDNDEYIPEIFDDSDFYHQLLRELIECKSADISDPVQLSRQWIALQQMRSKMKRKVDTKATKGRKIKYVVHNQLVNYMAQEKSTTWNDESTNELYSSLFGKMFESNNVGVNENLSSVFKIKN
ncbi:unnamed protein product [Diatraea saccharalis]|uniref:Protein AATF n=1 Tax=Diatraea saccharalis TaxID=40085 RepID=A0A9N9RGQ8_9NEOP|nr:unnamed protein product [Diatraea saccharalis]